MEEPGVIYAAAAPRAVGAADVRPRVPRQVLQQGLAGMRYQPGREAQESFRQAKARVVDGFESDYIRLALSRHQGNVARARALQQASAGFLGADAQAWHRCRTLPPAGRAGARLAPAALPGSGCAAVAAPRVANP
ncbi:hypothetical protein WJ966_20755 [Achromobacter xylosoxidans]